MNELIKIESRSVGEGEIPTVDARELHLKVESKQQFADWIKARVVGSPYFQENQDYVLLHNVMKQTCRGGHNRIDYALTLDTAKKVAMAEQTPVGNKIRDYFLACEKKAKTITPKELSRLELLQLALDSEKKRLAAEAINAKNQPLITAYKTMVDSDGIITLRAAAKIMEQPPNIFTKQLRDAKILYYLDGINTPHQVYLDRGYFVMKERTLLAGRKGNEGNKSYPQTYVTPKGLDWLQRSILPKLAETTSPPQIATCHIYKQTELHA